MLLKFTGKNVCLIAESDVESLTLIKIARKAENIGGGTEETPTVKRQYRRRRKYQKWASCDVCGREMKMGPGMASHKRGHKRAASLPSPLGVVRVPVVSEF